MRLTKIPGIADDDGPEAHRQQGDCSNQPRIREQVLQSTRHQDEASASPAHHGVLLSSLTGLALHSSPTVGSSLTRSTVLPGVAISRIRRASEPTQPPATPTNGSINTTVLLPRNRQIPSQTASRWARVRRLARTQCSRSGISMVLSAVIASLSAQAWPLSPRSTLILDTADRRSSRGAPRGTTITGSLGANRS